MAAGRAVLVSEESLRVAKLSDRAVLPSRGSSLSAGLDLASAYDYEIMPGEQCLVKTDLAIAVPRGTYGQIASRSGLATKNSIHVGAGVVDADFRGNVQILLLNLGHEKFEVNRGDRVAQLICSKISSPDLIWCENLEGTARGSGGFGSNGR